MGFVKYRLKEVATDFGKTPKEIADIISKYYDRPKSNQQVLTDAELNAVFDHMTKTNQVPSLEHIVSAAAKKPAAPKAEQPKTDAPKAEGGEKRRRTHRGGRRHRGGNGGNNAPKSE